MERPWKKKAKNGKDKRKNIIPTLYLGRNLWMTWLHKTLTFEYVRVQRWISGRCVRKTRPLRDARRQVMNLTKRNRRSYFDESFVKINNYQPKMQAGNTIFMLQIIGRIIWSKMLHSLPGWKSAQACRTELLPLSGQKPAKKEEKAVHRRIAKLLSKKKPQRCQFLNSLSGLCRLLCFKTRFCVWENRKGQYTQNHR